MTAHYGPYHRLGEPGGQGCPVAVLPVFTKGPGGTSAPADLLDGGKDATEVQVLRTVAQALGVRWGSDDLGWWAVVQGHSFPSWAVWRQDDSGQTYLVTANLTADAAQAMVAEFEARGHKQTYWCDDQRLDRR